MKTQDIVDELVSEMNNKKIPQDVIDDLISLKFNQEYALTVDGKTMYFRKIDKNLAIQPMD